MAREPPLSPRKSRGYLPLANPELGAKQICPSCSAKFYDLGKRPAVCPK
ncbi:TIGR02300 family protein, partial [Klebsiella pneumoniae]